MPASYTPPVRVQPPRKALPAWAFGLLALAALGAGLLLRPIVQSLLSPGPAAVAADPASPPVRCPGPGGGELALTETITRGGTDGIAGVQPGTPGRLLARDYRLERPGQPPLGFNGGGDSSSAPLECERVRFGPGPRVAFGRGPEAFVVELVGPVVRRWQATQDRGLTQLAVEPRWNLRLRAEDYAARAPEIAEDRTGRLVLERTEPAADLPARLVFTTENAGSSWILDRAATLTGLPGS